MFGTLHISGIYNLFSCRRKPNPGKQGLVESATPPPLPPRLPRLTTPAQVSRWLGHAHPRAVNHPGRRVGRGDPPQSRQRGKDVYTEGKSKLHTNNTVDLFPWRGRLIQGLRWSGTAGGGCRRRNGRCRSAAGAALAATLRHCGRAGDGGRSGWARLQRGN